MRKQTFLLVAGMALLLSLMLIPVSHARRRNAREDAGKNRASVPVKFAGVEATLTGSVSAAANPAATPEKGGRDTGPRIDSGAGQPPVMDARSALSAAVITTLGGRNSQFSEVSLLGNWDGREDFTADRSQKVDDFSTLEPDTDETLTRAAISEHTFANGFNENVYYYGDSRGNFWVGTDTTPGINVSASASIDVLRQINIPNLMNTGTSGGFTLLNPQAGDCTDDQVVVTGIAVNPVADLGDFGLCGTIGEVVYVSIEDRGGCSFNAANQPFRTRILAFAFTDGAGANAATPVGAIQILRNASGNTGGVAIDDDGNLYFHLSDPTTRLGSAIFKVTEGPRTVAGCAVNPRVNRVVASIPNGLNGTSTLNSAQGTGVAPVLIAGGYRLTNYTGNSTTFGNIVSMSFGPENTLYAAVARSLVNADDPATQATEGAFVNPAALGATPSMVISFSDVSGAFDACSSPGPGIPGAIPIGDGFADAAAAGLGRIAGVNNFRVFALGNGPDIRGTLAGDTLRVTAANTLKLNMQIDFSIHAGIVVDEEKTLYVISGGSPAGLGLNPSPGLGEILAFPDNCPTDRRADYIDLRGDVVPNPPSSGGNVGDFDSDRFDHIFMQAPLDSVSGTPTGLAGLARGFLLYTNRTRNRNADTLANLPNGGVQGDDATSGPLNFQDFDDGNQVAGGDDQNTPFRGDDNNGAGNPVLVGALAGGFEFSFGGTGIAATSIWNGFFLNSNGSITFGMGDTDNTPTIPELRTGFPRIAPAWADFNPAARAVAPVNFPVQALGFSNVNSFKVRWIGVPEFGNEGCSGGGQGSNTFAITLNDDGTSRDENEAQILDPADPTGDNVDPAYDEQEGPTDLRFRILADVGVSIGVPPRSDGTGHFAFDYGQMTMLGTDVQPIITGFSIGNTSPNNPPGLCITDLSEAARSADTSPFGVIQGQTASIVPCLLGEGTEPHIYELFNTGTPEDIGPGGEIIIAVPSFDLRDEGNDPALSKPVGQPDLNRGRVAFYGVGSLPPPNPLAVFTKPAGSVLVAPDQPAVGSMAAGTPGTGPGGTRAASVNAGIINALGDVPVNLFGVGFFPNEQTVICQGNPPPENAVPIQRPGKNVSTAVTLTCDTDGNGIPEATIVLGNVTPVNDNLVNANLASLDSAGLPGTAFPLACNGGVATYTLTTTFTAGDNNIFGPFTRTAVFTLDLGLRAPVVLGAVPSSGDATLQQALSINGSAFIINTAGGPVVNVTRVYAQQIDNPANIVDATSFTVLDPTHINAIFNFGAANAGRTFLIFASGPNGTSRNLVTATGDAPAGNEQGNIITFTTTDTVAPTITCPANITTNAPVGQNSVAVNYPAPVATDNQPGVTVNCNKASGSLFNAGTTTVTCTATDAANNTSACSFTVTVNSPNSFTFSQPNYDATEDVTFATVTVNRTNAAGAATIDYATSDGTAVQAKDYTIARGQLSFAAGETSKSFQVLISEDSFAEGTEQLSITLSNAQNGVLGGSNTATVTIFDDVAEPATNAIDDATIFVGQQYHDFLNRQADAAGLAFWVNNITKCADPAQRPPGQTEAQCVDRQRVTTSAAFFLSPEFQYTGGFVYNLYKGSLPGTPNYDGGGMGRFPLYEEFMRDTQRVARGIVVGGALSGAVIEQNKLALANEFVTRAEFVAIHGALSNSAYVDKLFQTTGITPTAAERTALINGLNAATETRATVLMKVVDGSVVISEGNVQYTTTFGKAFIDQEFNRKFVYMEYVGYLRRDPDAAGFQFWLGKLITFGNFIDAEMVRSFIVSPEYRQRFGQP